VLVVSASMGAGHDGAARELAARLNEQGHHASVRDFLDTAPLRLGTALRGGYEFELKHIPSAYDLTYRLWYRVPWLCGPVGWLIALLTRRRLLGWVADEGADVVVSTYPLATITLGRLRASGRLDVPAVNFITDFGVHPMWVHRGIDVDLAVHPSPAGAAARRTGRPAVACGPVVSAAFEPAPDRAGQRRAARRRFGLEPEDRAVMVVAGSWGVGGLMETFRAVATDGRFVPVVVCGRDDALRATLTHHVANTPGRAVIVGWTDQMAALMAACDCLVENAGGLTSLEALRAGLPVISYQPIAGHGKENTAAMAAAGVSRMAAGVTQLLAALDAVSAPGPARDDQIATGRAMFVGDGSAHIVGAARSLPLGAPLPWRRPARVATRIAVAGAVLLGLVWAGLTSGVEAAAEGAGVAYPAPGTGAPTYVGVRLDEAQMATAGVPAVPLDSLR